VINAPPVFTKFWSLIKSWLDKGILDKVKILGDNYKDVLLEFIDKENLPAVRFCYHAANLELNLCIDIWW
jgi:glucan endo-1,3-alpha-glucosidase